MKYVDEYRTAASAQHYAREVARITIRPWTIMEVCGGQTHAIMKFGDQLLPPPSRWFTVQAVLFV